LRGNRTARKTETEETAAEKLVISSPRLRLPFRNFPFARIFHQDFSLRIPAAFANKMRFESAMAIPRGSASQSRVQTNIHQSLSLSPSSPHLCD